MVLKKEMRAMQEHYGKKPLRYLELCVPKWLSARDPVGKVFEEKYTLIREGTVAWAHIVQANGLLYRFLPFGAYPADIVFSKDPLVMEHPQILGDMARKIYSYKDKPEGAVPEEYRQVARCITNEYARPSFTIYTDYEGRPVEIQLISVLIFRKLLPMGRLRGGFLPVLTAPGSKTVLTLPKQYWTGKFRRAWLAGQV